MGNSRAVANPGLQTESLFHTYSQFSTAPNIPQKPTEEERTTEARLEDLLAKVRQLSAHHAASLD
jgi:Golgi SNAP receptor complex protein 1